MSLEESMVSITEHYEEVIWIIRNIDKTAMSAPDLAMPYSALIAKNTKKDI